MVSDILNPPRGMRDLTGVEAWVHEYLVNTFKKTAVSTGFEPIITPTVEYFKLFEAKSGEEVKNSMYVFQDKAGRLLALRPEVTASVVRAYLKGLRSEPKPLKLYYVAQCFRYEEPQHARYREFWQAGLEVIGDPDVNADLSAAFTASVFLDEIGVGHEYVVGSVAVHRGLMKGLGIPEEAQDHVLHLIDKGLVDKALEEASKHSGKGDAGLLKDLLNTPLEKLEGFINDSKELLGGDYERVLKEHERLLEFTEALRSLGYRVEYSPSLVRGLAYYTGLIFEYKTKTLGVSIGGGGRYDGLTMVYGGVFEHSTGLALGLDRIALVLQGVKTPGGGGGVAVILSSKVPVSHGYRVAGALVKAGFKATVYRSPGFSKPLGHAARKGYSRAVIIGEKEFNEGSATVKNLETGAQSTIKLQELLENPVKHLS
ncbi:histidine--tRNA ligase [Thermosphaera sp.]